MKIGFVGAGKVGFTLGKYFMERNHGCVSGYYNRNLEHAKEAAAFTKTKYYEKLEELVEASDTLFLTVPDGSIREVYSEILLLDSEIAGKHICHCSGVLSSEVFSGIRTRGAYAYSIHPIFAVSDKLTSYQEFSKAYITIEGSEEHLEQMMEFIRQLGNPVEIISAEQKVRYHLAAVFASNLTVGLYEMATSILESTGVSETFAKSALQPMFLQNAQNICKQGVQNALTGPVERGDAGTVQKHLAVMSEPERQVYQALSQQLREIAGRKNPERNYGPIDEILEKKGMDIR